MMCNWMISSSVLLAVMIALRAALQGKINLQLQYALWGLVLIRLLVPMQFGATAMSVMNITTAAFAQSAPTVVAYIDTSSPETIFLAPEDVRIPETENTTLHEPLATWDADTVLSQHTAPTPITTATIAIILWAIGACAVGLWFVYTNLRFYALLCRTRSPLTMPNCARRVYLSTAIETPCLFGLVSPAIYLTPDILTDETVLRHAIAHEETHYRHGDHVWSILRGVCLALHWCNPLAWWAGALSCKDSELACDDATIRRIGEHERAQYGRTLIAMTCEQRAPLLLTATALSHDQTTIKERITRIAHAPNMALYTAICVTVLALAAVGCTFTGAANSGTLAPDSAATSSSESSGNGISTSTTPAASSVSSVSAAQPNAPHELVLASMYVDDSLVAMVDAFNAESPNTTITLKNYADAATVAADAENGTTPDLYLMPSARYWPMDALIARGSFIDLLPLLEHDPTLAESDFFPSLLDACEHDGALYCFPISFTVEGIWAQPAYTNGNTLTLDALPTLRAQYPENDMLFGALTAMDLLEAEVSQNWNDYIDWKHQTCSFDNDYFIRALEAAHALPDYLPADSDEMTAFASGAYLRSGEQLLLPYTISDFAAYSMSTAGMPGAFDVVFNAFDSDMVSATLTDNAAVFDIRRSCAISSTCENPEAAWAFVRTFLAADYQRAFPLSAAPSLPSNMDAFNAERDSMIANGMGSAEQFAPMRACIDAAHTQRASDAQIEQIIYEEATAYFAGEQTSEAAAAAIQQRVSAYVIG